MKRLTFLIALASSSFAFAQEQVPAKHARFVLLGELPVWRDKVINNIRVQQAPKPGSTPPTLVTYSQGDEVKTLKLGLQSVSDIASFPGDAGGILLKEGSGPDGKDFLKMGMPAASLSLGVVFRDLQKMDWRAPQLLMLRDDAQSFPVGQMRFVNVSDSTVLVMIDGGKSFGIAPGKTSLKPFKLGKTKVGIGYVTADGGQELLWKNSVTFRKGERGQFFFYKAQGKNPPKAVKYHMVTEIVPKLPKPKAKGR